VHIFAIPIKFVIIIIIFIIIIIIIIIIIDRLCGPVVGSWLQIQRSGFDSQRYQIF
jgi:hypothetical protein